ncbi:putative transmembrane protein YshB [Lentibacillus sp. JNUCC-1]|uniref:CvpA family protein n=1 Tax=Lentibacillus sp. JNUCC-1 TaxID=2654513 RepID=UPI0012E74A65|nr:CvpA family protein [Lentibacillus sp. JNUCC-1]MUV39377.1 putative transmembrane protein YshB [Lentibacillus sp. JNUCC-1]
MIDVLLFILLVFGFLMGLKRGLILQALHLTGFIIAFAVAVIYYDDLAEKLIVFIPYPDLPEDATWAVFLQTLPLESAFYNAIAFAIIFFAVKILIQIIASMLDFVASLPILNSVNSLLGALLGFMEVYLILFVVLYILALVPMGNVQAWISDSSIAMFIIEHTPILSEKIRTMWLENGSA